MDTMTVLAQCADRGITLTMRGDELEYGASDPLPPELLAGLREYKAEILEGKGQWRLFLFERPLPTDDPRPDLATDSRLWWSLLNLAWGHDHELWASLHGLRCMGARLEMHERRLVLARGSYITTEEYAAWRAEYLLPKAELLQRLIHEV